MLNVTHNYLRLEQHTSCDKNIIVLCMFLLAILQNISIYSIAVRVLNEILLSKGED